MNWLDRDLFLSAAHDLLIDGGWLVVYDGGDLGRMVGADEFGRWHQREYRKRLPRPPRDERPVTEDDAQAHGFGIILSDDYVLELPFTLRAYVGFLLTESRMSAAVEQRAESLAPIQRWLTDSLRPHFGESERRILFGGPMWCLRRL